MTVVQRCHELTLADEIRCTLRDSPDLQLFGLIDGTVTNSALDPFFQLAPEAEYDPLFLDTEYAACLPYSPYLIHLDAAAADFLQQYGHWCDSGVIWMLSTGNLSRQAGFWRSLIQVMTPDNKVALLRFWSAPILAGLLEHSSDGERATLLASCRTLYTPDTDRHWRRWQGPDTATDTKAQPTPWWQLQHHHLQGFAAGFERLLVDEIEDQLWRTEPEAIATVYPPLLPDLIRDGNGIARTLGLQSDAALLWFARCRLRLGLDFWRHPALTDLWHPLTPTEQAFVQWADKALSHA